MEVFAKNNPFPSSKQVTFHRSDPLEIIAEYSQPALLPPGSDTLIEKVVIPSVPHKEGETPKVRVKVKVDLHGIFSVETAQAIKTVEEEAPAAAPVAEKAKEGDTATPMEQEPSKLERGRTGSNDSGTPEAAKTETPKEGEKVNPRHEDRPDRSQKEEAKKEEPKKKKVTRTELKFTEISSGLTEKEIQELTEEEAKMMASDRLAIETAEQKNAVESYVYDMRSKLHESLAPFATEQSRTQFSQLLEQTESWLYGDGEDVPKSVYSQKLAELKSMGDPIIKRKYEDENRYEAIMQLRGIIQSLTLTAESEVNLRQPSSC